jgi:hypothetical protein
MDDEVRRVNFEGPVGWADDERLVLTRLERREYVPGAARVGIAWRGPTAVATGVRASDAWAAHRHTADIASRKRIVREACGMQQSQGNRGGAVAPMRQS